MSDHPPASHHLPLRECFPDVWLASSANAMSIPVGLKITFSRNMVAVRVPDGWVLLNPVRLSEGAGRGLQEGHASRVRRLPTAASVARDLRQRAALRPRSPDLHAREARHVPDGVLHPVRDRADLAEGGDAAGREHARRLRALARARLRPPDFGP